MHVTHGWIHIRDLHIAHVSIGIYPHERTQTQPVVINLALWVDIATPARTGHLGDSVDYAAVAQRVRAVTTAKHFDLLESLCESIATAVLCESRVDKAYVQVCKPEALPDAQVSIAVTRSRR